MYNFKEELNWVVDEYVPIFKEMNKCTTIATESFLEEIMREVDETGTFMEYYFDENIISVFEFLVGLYDDIDITSVLEIKERTRELFGFYGLWDLYKTDAGQGLVVWSY